MGASEHAYGLLMKALYKREASGEGTCINLSMFESSVSWLPIPITLSSFGKKITRHGNTHEFFCPVSVYRTSNGFVYLAVGNDRQWKTMVSQKIFQSLDKPEYEKNAGRIEDVENLNHAINEITKNHPSEEIIDLLNSITVPVSKIKSIKNDNGAASQYDAFSPGNQPGTVIPPSVWGAQPRDLYRRTRVF